MGFDWKTGRGVLLEKDAPALYVALFILMVTLSSCLPTVAPARVVITPVVQPRGVATTPTTTEAKTSPQILAPATLTPTASTTPVLATTAAPAAAGVAATIEPVKTLTGEQPAAGRAASDQTLAPAALLELGKVEMASGDYVAARQTFQRVLASSPGEPLAARTKFLLTTAERALGDWQATLRLLDVQSAPDGLTDLVVLRRAEAAVKDGNPDGARGELGRPEMRQSTNRIILGQAGQLAERLDNPALAAELYLRATRYPGWPAERSRLIHSAAAAFERAGQVSQAIEQYRRLIQLYGWTTLAQQAGPALKRLGGLTPYHRGLLAMSAGRNEAAQEAFSEAAAEGPYVTQASNLLRYLAERAVWLEVIENGTAEAFRSFRQRYPDGNFAAEAWFREGLTDYQAGRFTRAVSVWDEAMAKASGGERARLSFWAGKALAQLGHGAESRARLQAAAETRPAGYYALRARDLLVGVAGWPTVAAGPKINADAERVEVERWLAGWSGTPPSVDVAQNTRVRRGLGLLALGLPAESQAEFDGLIEESQNGRFLFQLGGRLAKLELWHSASRAALRLIALSPAKTVVEAPAAVQRLAYPLAYWDIVGAETEPRGLDPWLLLALIHQESLYDPFAISAADARGLTQVISPTGRGIASALGRTGFTPDDLYQPAVAIEFGAWYLTNQIVRFGGDLFQAIAAYNAGAGPVPGWAAADPDLFVERIDYSETRRYVREVYLHHAIYRALAGS